jgi:hypothetical protein
MRGAVDRAFIYAVETGSRWAELNKILGFLDKLPMINKK